MSTWGDSPPHSVVCAPQNWSACLCRAIVDGLAQGSLSSEDTMRSILLLLTAIATMNASTGLAAPKKKSAPVVAKKVPAPVSPLPSSVPETPAAAEAPAPGTRGPARIDFDDRLIQGQSNKSGAVYLYDRKELKIRSMVKKRENFREEIVGSLYDT